MQTQTPMIDGHGSASRKGRAKQRFVSCDGAIFRIGQRDWQRLKDACTRGDDVYIDQFGKMIAEKVHRLDDLKQGYFED